MIWKPKKNKVMKLLCLYIYIWIKYELNSNYYLFFNVCVYFWFVFHFLGEISLVFCMFFILPLFSKYLWVTFCYKSYPYYLNFLYLVIHSCGTKQPRCIKTLITYRVIAFRVGDLLLWNYERKIGTFTNVYV